MKEKIGKYGGLLFFALVAVFVIKLLGINLGSDEVNVYSLTCWVFQADGTCASNGWSGNKNTYIVRANLQ